MYSEVLNFKACTVDQLASDMHDIDIDSFLYFVADNVDHNSDTINKLNAIHSMGIACVINAKKCQVPAFKRTNIESSEAVETVKLKTKCFNFFVTSN